MTFLRPLFLASIVLFIFVFIGAAPIPESSKKLDQQSEVIILSVGKKQLTADLVAWPEIPKQVNGFAGRVLKSYPIAIGKADGDKQKEGDLKTPEGIYFTRDIIDGDSLPDKYGPKAIPIDFPNPIDSMMGKTGHGIWLHGAGDDGRIKESRVTDGCVAFFNHDIERLVNWLKPNQAIVVIAEDAAAINNAKDLEQVASKTNDWLDSWNTRNLDKYISFYGKNFISSKGGVAEYRSYKKRVFNQYKKMEVAGDTIRVITHPKYAISIMNQMFRGDGFFSDKGRKILYWQRSPENGEWFITRELFEKRKLKPFTFTNHEISLLSDDLPGYPTYSEKGSKSAPKL